MPHMPRHLVNVHTHHRSDRDFEAHLAEWTNQGATATCVACVGPEWRRDGFGLYTNDDLLPWLRKYPEQIVGMAFVETAGRVDGGDEVQRWYDLGFRGLKMICPEAPYDDGRYYAVYERAQSLKMPILFHTGYVGGTTNARLYARSHSEYMRPWRLEHACRRFPELRVIGAHLGKPHIHEALCLIEVFPWVYYDFSGGSGNLNWQEDILRALTPRPGVDMADPEQNAALRYFRKLCFATDNPPVAKWYAASEYIMDSLQVPPDLREDFYWRNAAKLFDLTHLLEG